jgi:RNA polymerase sigma-70 factor (ECF subfamily)
MNKEKIFTKLYDAHWLEIQKFIFVQARRDAGYTEEIFQNTWENAWRYLHTLKDPDAARAWLYSIARNEAKRFFADRHVKIFTNVIPFSAASGSGDSADGGTDGAEASADPQASLFPEKLADEHLLATLLGRLSDEEQQLILLHYAYDMSLKDISTLYDVNYNTLKSITRRALSRLRAMAEEA